jgi:hypothetical protein
MSRTLAHGATLYLGDAEEPEGFDSVPYIGAIDVPVPDLEIADITSHTDDYHEELEGIQEIADMDVPITWDAAEPTHVEIRDLARDGAARNWKVVTNSGTTLAFPAKVRSRALALGLINKAEEFKFKLHITGAMVITDAT